MKKVLIALSAITALGTLSANAQTTVRFGVKADLNLAQSQASIVSFKQSYDLDAKMNPGFTGGAFAQFSFVNPSDKFKLQVEALYNYYNIKNSTTIAGTEVKIKANVHSVQVPVLAKYFITPSFSIFAGPTFNFHLGMNQSIAFGNVVYDQDVKDDIDMFKIGGTVGVNYYVWKGMFVEARYNYIGKGFLEGNNQQSNTQYGNVNAIQIGLGYKFK